MEPTIGIVTALPHEYVAVKQLLQNGKDVREGKGGAVWFWLANLPSRHGGSHRIALHLAGMGNNIAGIVASTMLTRFPSIRYLIFSGIAGGVPDPGSAENHVRLGDVVVSAKSGVTQYDFIKATANGRALRATPLPSAPLLLGAYNQLRTRMLQNQFPWEPLLKEGLKALKWSRPSEQTDVLISTDGKKSVLRHPKDASRRPGMPKLIQGPIASANVLLKDAKWRDRLRKEFKAKAVEMEGAGLADATWTLERGYFIVRGICDYCDSNKNDLWQQYAAMAAASVTIALLQELPGDQSISVQPSIEPAMKLTAEFVLKNGKPKRKNKHFVMRLTLHSAPPETGSVVFQYDHKSIDDQFDEVSVEPDGTFMSECELYGDVQVRATAWRGDKGYSIARRLYEALADHYGMGDISKPIKKALQKIYDN